MCPMAPPETPGSGVVLQVEGSLVSLICTFQGARRAAGCTGVLLYQGGGTGAP